MLNLKPYSAVVLAFGGLLLILTGLYFIFIRPALLPEDAIYMKSGISTLEKNLPELLKWLQKVFWVLGGYILTSGILTIFIALTTFRMRSYGAFSIVLLTGCSSIGLMTLVNFIIFSDFKWILASFTLPWLSALILFRFHK